MLNRIRAHIVEDCISKGYSHALKEDIETALAEADVLYRERISECKGWNLEWRVVEINGMFIKFEYGYTIGNTPLHELGYMFDFDSVHEVRPVEKNVVLYERV